MGTRSQLVVAGVYIPSSTRYSLFDVDAMGIVMRPIGTPDLADSGLGWGGRPAALVTDGYFADSPVTESAVNGACPPG